MLTADVVWAELLKVRSRWLPYVLLLPVAGLLALQTFAAYFGGWRHDGDPDALRWSALPTSLASILDLLQYLMSIVVGIVAASAIATEHAWGTVRQAISRGQTRSQYLLMKLAGILVLGAALFLAALLIGLLFSAIVSSMEDELPSGPSIGEGVLIVARAAYTTLPYVLLAYCMTVVGRSTALGVGGILFFIIGESIVVGVLGGFSATEGWRALFLGHNVTAVLAANRVFPEDAVSIAPRASPPVSELPDPWVGALVVALYCAAFLAIAFYVFNRRDLEAGSGAT
jgi:ABC-type transport system involved in multi-copper enzyme maturation permease subunit